jgi:hypothetical protein
LRAEEWLHAFDAFTGGEVDAPPDRVVALDADPDRGKLRVADSQRGLDVPIRVEAGSTLATIASESRYLVPMGLSAGDWVASFFTAAVRAEPGRLSRSACGRRMLERPRHLPDLVQRSNQLRGLRSPYCVRDADGVPRCSAAGCPREGCARTRCVKEDTEVTCDCAGDWICAGGRSWCRGSAREGFSCVEP